MTKTKIKDNRAWTVSIGETAAAVKTPIVRRAASDLGVEMVDAPMPMIEPTAFRGLPIA